jgi:hypothetical protein
VQVTDRNKALLAEYLERLLPGAKVERLSALGEDAAKADGAEKAFGYGQPIRVELRTAAGERRKLVFHVAKSNSFGHDRRADRAEDAVLSFDTYGLIPNHAAAVDFGVMLPGELLSLRNAGEFFMITEYAEGEPYAQELAAIGSREGLLDEDLERCAALAEYLATLHSKKIADRDAYRRSIRDLVGHGEGIFGLVDNFPGDVDGAPKERIDRLESQCVAWRRRLRGGEARLSRIHGDFHPFNILFGKDGTLTLLDASRGCQGDPADDATCLAVNYLFFGLEHATPASFRLLWDRFWEQYLSKSGDHEILTIAPPFLAWRTLVLTNPVWYPNVSAATREALLGLAENSLDSGRLDLAAAAGLLR